MCIFRYDHSWEKRTAGTMCASFHFEINSMKHLKTLQPSRCCILRSHDPRKVKSLWADWGVGWQTQRSNLGLRGTIAIAKWCWLFLFMPVGNFWFGHWSNLVAGSYMDIGLTMINLPNLTPKGFVPRAHHPRLAGILARILQRSLAGKLGSKSFAPILEGLGKISVTITYPKNEINLRKQLKLRRLQRAGSKLLIAGKYQECDVWVFEL